METNEKRFSNRNKTTDVAKFTGTKRSWMGSGSRGSEVAEREVQPTDYCSAITIHFGAALPAH
jgi:hypothetical protein